MSANVHQEHQQANAYDAQDWPRDFDIRAEFAEQQELLMPPETKPKSARSSGPTDEK